MAKQQIEETDDFSEEVAESFELVHIDEDVYDAELTKLVKLLDVEVEREGAVEKVDMLKWTFTTPDGIEIDGTSSVKFTPKSKAYGWATKLLGKEPEIGQSLGPKELVGNACKIVVKDKTRTAEFQGKSEKQIFSIVQDVLSAKKEKKEPEKKKE
jgi:Arc/MetJ family transcription regulator